MKRFFDNFKQKKEDKPWIDLKQLREVVNMAKGERTLEQFLQDMNLTAQYEPIVDMLDGVYNKYVRPYHIQKIADVAYNGITLEDLNQFFGFTFKKDLIQQLTDIKISKWEIVQADLGNPLDSEQGGIRSVVIVSPTEINDVTTTVYIVPITTSTGKSHISANIHIGRESGLIEDSCILVNHARSISKSRLVMSGTITRFGEVHESLRPKIHSEIMRQFGVIDRIFNPKIAKNMVRAIEEVMLVIEETDYKLSYVKDQIWDDFKNYCRDYGKDYKKVYNEFVNKTSENYSFNRLAYVG